MAKKIVREMEAGEKFASPIRVISESDVKKYDEIRVISGPMHDSDEYAKSVGFEQRIVSSGLIFSMVNMLVGQAIEIENPIAFLGVKNMSFKAPLYPGEGMMVEGELTGKRDSKSRNAIVLTYTWRAKKEDGTVIATGESSEMAGK